MITHISNGSYFDTIIISVGSNWKQLDRYYKKIYETDEEIPLDKDCFKDCVGFFDEDADVLWLKEWNNKKADRDTLTHECHHATQFLLGKRRAMFEEPEALAYHQDFLIETISAILNKERKGL